MDKPLNVRMTKQRLAILKATKSSKCHPTANEVYLMVRTKMPNISLGTVYRNLEVLAEKGLIRRLGPYDDKMRFDGDISDHHHVKCVFCGRIDDVELKEKPEIEGSVPCLPGYKIISYGIEFEGICPECQKKGH